MVKYITPPPLLKLDCVKLLFNDEKYVGITNKCWMGNQKAEGVSEGMFAKSSTGIDVKVENSRVIVAGREYVKEHILVVGADSLKTRVDAEKGVTLEASFSEPPSIESVERDTVAVKKEGSKLVLDALGSTITSVKDYEGYIVVEAETFTLKFEVDSDGVNAYLPGVGRLKAKELVVESKVTSSINMITVPFTTGIVTATGGVRAKILLRDNLLKVEISGK